jgi:PAS domain-containing protein
MRGRRLSVFTPGQWPLHVDEDARLNALRNLNVLDTAGERAFDNIVRFTRERFEAPICLISLVDQNRQWFKSCYGLSIDQTGRDTSFCAHAIMPEVEGILEVCDATKDDRFCNNPLVLSEPHIRYYAGVPLEVTIDDKAFKMGTLCVIDTKPRLAMGAPEREHFMLLASMVVDHLHSRLSSHRLQTLNAELLRRTAEVNAVNRELTAIINTANAPIFAIDSQMRVTAWNHKISEITSVSSTEVCGLHISDVIGVRPSGVSSAGGGVENAPADDKPWLNLGVHAEPGDEEKPFVVALASALDGQSIACFDLVMGSRYHDRKIHLQVSAEPKIGPDGQVVGVVCVGEDVALRQSMLETRMRNRELQKTNEAKDAFLACMSHEMRTPLNGLLGMLQVTTNAPPPSAGTALRPAR